MLVAETTIDHKLKPIIFVGAFQQFLAFPGGGEHIGGDHVGQAIVVHVGNVDAHRVARHVHKGRLSGLDKVPVLIVDVEIILLFVVVAHVQIGPAIAGQIAHRHAQPEVDAPPVDARLVGDVGEVVPLVPVQPVAEIRMPFVAEFVGVEKR